MEGFPYFSPSMSRYTSSTHTEQFSSPLYLCVMTADCLKNLTFFEKIVIIFCLCLLSQMVYVELCILLELPSIKCCWAIVLVNG